MIPMSAPGRNRPRSSATLIVLAIPILALMGGCAHEKEAAAPAPAPTVSATSPSSGPYGSSNEQDAILRARSVAKASLGDLVDLRHPTARFTSIVLPGAAAPLIGGTSSTALTPGWVVDFQVSRLPGRDPADIPTAIANPAPPSIRGPQYVMPAPPLNPDLLPRTGAEGPPGDSRPPPPTVTPPGALGVQVPMGSNMPIPGQQMPSIDMPSAGTAATVTVFVAVDGHGMVMGRSQ